TAALVTSGTATLETALFNVPQVVCYKTPVPRLVRFVFKHFMGCKFISLVNLIADREVVRELFADRFSVENIRAELRRLLPATMFARRCSSTTATCKNASPPTSPPRHPSNRPPLPKMPPD
ncbi:MAG: hypothetical protein II509_04160, partial [Prevotella sp.]|nr:hypothetical protein [Prevotella sp.]